MATNCTLCAQVVGLRDRDLVYRHLGRSATLAASTHAVAFPSLGALTPGHVIVCPRRHARSWAACPPDVFKDGQRLLAELQQALGRLGPVHAFEHGNGEWSSRVACSVEHAHIHLVPADVDLADALQPLGAWKPLCPGREALRQATRGAEYLVYRAPDGETRVSIAGVDQAISSQLMRRVFSSALGRPSEWNWRTHLALDRVAATFDAVEPRMLALSG